MKIKSYLPITERAQIFRNRVKTSSFTTKPGEDLSQVMFELETLIEGYDENELYDLHLTALERVDIRTIQSLGEGVDFDKILQSSRDARLVLFGEDHSENINSLKLLASFLGPLYSAGFHHYGVELLRVIDDQPFLNDFLDRGETGRGQFIKHISDPKIMGVMAGAADDHLKVFDLAIRLGIDLYPLTHPRELNDDFSHYAHLRDCFMSLVINAAIAWGEKMFCLMGGGHIGVDYGISRILLEEFGYQSISVQMLQRSDVSEAFMIKYSRELKERLDHNSKLNRKFADIPPKEGSWIIFLPHTPRA
ncbi:MAG: hypothetical protein HQ564_01590 [Candidatus Saganbacteria bacterium]|nr:hypothetical protein [Candidatus Saganbacteria bacterium]